MPIRIELKFPATEALALEKILSMAISRAGSPGGQAVLMRKSIDARRVPTFLYAIDVYPPGEEPLKVQGFQLQQVGNREEVHIVGMGPAGIFAAMQLIELGYKPVILERGKDVRRRRFDLADLVKNHQVNEDSNYCFGEGGAGTYSDGKLYTRSSKRGPVHKVLASLHEHGAADNVLYEAHPHIGTNKLPAIIENYRKSIIECGGEVLFDCRVAGFKRDSSKITGVVLASGELLPVKHLILATGHSARDIFELLHREKVAVEAKPFALGVRMEHHQSLVDAIQYHCKVRPEVLPAASYSLVEQVMGRGVFSFCMCPGGIIAPAATASGEVVVNGWSPSKRNGEFANSGFVVSVDHKDFKPFEKFGPLAGMEYQKHWEQIAFQTAGNLTAPAQRIEDFIQKKTSTTLPACSYLPGIQSRAIDEVVSSEIAVRLREALVALGKKMHGFRTNEAILVGVESRTSSPVKIPRDPAALHHVELSNLYPTGEGAGYAGGIMSAALDGMRVADSVVRAIQNS